MGMCTEERDLMLRRIKKHQEKISNVTRAHKDLVELSKEGGDSFLSLVEATGELLCKYCSLTGAFVENLLELADQQDEDKK